MFRNKYPKIFEIIKKDFKLNEEKCEIIVNNCINKIKENKRIILKTTISVLVVFIFAFSFYNLNNPTYFNKLLASIIFAHLLLPSSKGCILIKLI